MYVSCFQLIFRNLFGIAYEKTSYSLYKNSLTLCYSNMVIDLLHNYSVNFIVATLCLIVSQVS